ncbi:MAG: epoxyqueuosine reductase QueH [Actinobacteria bacterium]|nr:epoxyqueuosine reductase QueH [Actinomycetota bacterium]
MTRLMLHVCCGPCASATIPFWRQRGVDPVGLFFNPNIHPLLEYRRRLTGAHEVADMSRVELVTDEAYDPEVWFGSVAGEAGTRCSRCIGLRLERTAREAVALDCDAFSTTLAISPWQDHEAIATEGAQAAERHGVEFAYEDLRPLYRESRRLSREWGIYRQKYCGCLVSEWERYRGS